MAEAEEHLTEVTRLLPSFAQGYNSLGVLRQQQDRRTEAIACFRKALQCDPESWQSHLNLGYALLAEGDQEKAAAEFRETLRLNPTCEPARQWLGSAQP